MGPRGFYIGQDCEEIPAFIGEQYGGFAKRLDLSFNLLRDSNRILFLSGFDSEPYQNFWLWFRKFRTADFVPCRFELNEITVNTG
ncbi:UNVERIFIED_CONTAM: hypothetical protein FKN15_004191 [Acipenser sinensis]